MMEQEENHKRNSKLSYLLVLLTLGIFFYFYQYNPSSKEGFFLRCPSNLIFGINCPGCGTQRALHHLLHLEILEALRYNVLFVIIFIFSVFYAIGYLLGYKKTTLFFTNKYVMIGLLIIILLYGILRNIPIYPFTLLSP